MKTVLVQVLITNLLIYKVCRVAECAVVTPPPKSKGAPVKVFVTEIDASKFFRERNTCSVVYCFGPRNRAQEERDKKEERKQSHEERKIEHEEREKEHEEEKRQKWNEILEGLKQ